MAIDIEDHQVVAGRGRPSPPAPSALQSPPSVSTVSDARPETDRVLDHRVRDPRGDVPRRTVMTLDDSIGPVRFQTAPIFGDGLSIRDRPRLQGQDEAEIPAEPGLRAAR